MKGSVSARTITVVLVDDHELARQGVRNLLKRDSKIKVIGEASDSDEAISLIGRLQPDVAILDIRLNQGSGIDVAKTSRSTAPNTGILILTAYDCDQYVVSLAKLGVSGYLLKTASAQELRRAVYDTVEGRLVFAPGVADKVKSFFAEKGRRVSSQVSRTGTLTARENEVLKCIGRGLRNAEIAREMGITLKTVETHVEHILLKLDVKSRTQAVINATERGLL